MSDDEFIKTSIAHQIGSLPKGPITIDQAAQDLALAASSGSLLWWQHEKSAPYPDNGWVLDGSKTADNPQNILNNLHWVNREKTVGALRDIQAAGADFDLFIDMQDRRLRNLVTKAGTVQPVFSFNRLDGAVGRILWPLPGYQDVNAPEYLGNLTPDRIPWAQKRDQIAWRGITGGRANPKADVRHERIRLKPLIKKSKSGEFSPEKVKRLLGSFPRHRFIERFHKDPRFDVGFVDGNGFILRAEPLLAHLEKPRIERRDFQEFKYIAVLRGLDVGSSFYWTMNSGSLGLVMETPFSSFASCHFKPWQHYVPFREDLSDMEERLSWCQKNQDQCQEMVRSATEQCKLLAQPHLRALVARGVVDEYRSRL